MYIVESDFYYRGYRCVTIFGDMGWRCGYVGLPMGHLLYGKDYRDTLNITYKELENELIDKRGIIPALISTIQKPEDEVTIDFYFNVHGSITYAGQGHPIDNNLWWLGFDCGHCMDAPDIELLKELWGNDERVKNRIENALIFEDTEVRTLEYVQQECRNLVDQIIEYVDKISEIDGEK